MRRGPKPAKSKSESRPPVARKSPKDDDAGVRDLEKRLAEALRDKTEAQEQQAATAEILRIISSSPSDLQPVMQTIAESAVRLADADNAMIGRAEGDHIRWLAVAGTLSPERPHVSHQPINRSLPSGRAIIDRQTTQVEDISVYGDEFPGVAAAYRKLGVRTILATPLLREGNSIGVIAVRRTTVRPFTDQQIALLKTFADQAVIAIENVRLFTELQEKNKALTTAHAQVSEALEQQTATSEILRVISQSPTDIRPVFRTILEAAARLANTDVASVWLHEGDGLLRCIHAIATGNIEWMIGTLVRAEESIYRSASSRRGQPAQVADIRTTKPYEAGDPLYKRTGDEMGVRTSLSVPFVAGGRLLGGFIVNRLEVRPFADEDIALLQTFADQAVIAIENVRLFKELEVANRELLAASQHKSEFLANMSHELRTPLNAIIGFSEVLGDRMFGELNEKQEEYLKDINASGNHLLSLINDILDLSKIEAGRMELELTDFHLPTAVENALMLVRERAGRRSIAIHTNIDTRLGQIQADERKVRQVVLNLLSNAIKFTPEGGRIDVSAVPKDGFVEVSVSDTGIGIAPEDQEKVFEEFRQVGTAAKKVEGTGLGLTLSRKFVELHGGRIWVKSEVGVGSTFSFTLPLRRGE